MSKYHVSPPSRGLRTILLCGIVLSFGIAILLAAAPRAATTMAAAPRAAAPLEKWEYAHILRVRDFIVKLNLPGRRSVSGKSWGDLYRKLGGKADGGIIGILNILGRQGWELFLFDPKTHKDFNGYYFKRRIR